MIACFSTSGKTILSAPDAQTIGPLKRRDGEPVFDEAWQAQVLAMADSLTKHGAFTASEWSDALGAELRRSMRDGVADNAETYYQAALRALERLLDGGGAWERAYLTTPHGKPVSLD